MAAKQSIRRKASDESFILIRPAYPQNSDTVAKAIAACRGVRKVFFTSGDYGFVVHTSGGVKYAPEAVHDAVSKATRGSETTLIKGHYVYSIL